MSSAHRWTFHIENEVEIECLFKISLSLIDIAIESPRSLFAHALVPPLTGNLWPIPHLRHLWP